MSLTKDYTPKYPIPNCIRTKFIKGIILNSVGLSNPGIASLLANENWQNRDRPFFISVMSLGETFEKRLEELRLILETISYCKDDFKSKFGIQINLSCPNTCHLPSELIKESIKVLDVASDLGVPLMPKFSIASAPIEAMIELGQHPHCDSICVSNTIPFGWKGIDW